MIVAGLRRRANGIYGGRLNRIAQAAAVNAVPR
jgi:hypothetical protein